MIGDRCAASTREDAPGPAPNPKEARCSLVASGLASACAWPTVCTTCTSAILLNTVHVIIPDNTVVDEFVDGTQQVCVDFVPER